MHPNREAFGALGPQGIEAFISTERDSMSIFLKLPFPETALLPLVVDSPIARMTLVPQKVLICKSRPDEI